MTSVERGAKRGHAFLAPEVVQTSKMDCGPAALKSLLEGFGIDVVYGRLREACQTDVDGTSIDVIEEVARRLGLDAEQCMVPLDHVAVPEAAPLPAMVVVSGAGGSTHFVVVWRRHGRWYQVMDPAVGRRWLTREDLERELYVHTMLVPEAALRDWAVSDAFMVPLGRRLRDLGVPAEARARLTAFAIAGPGCERLGALDAATRFVTRLVVSNGLARGESLEALLGRLMVTQKRDSAIPEAFWSFWPAEARDGTAMLRGAVLIAVQRSPAPAEGDEPDANDELSTALLSTIRTPIESPWRALWRYVRRDGVLGPSVVAAALFASAGALLAQSLVLRAVLSGFRRFLGTGGQRLGACGAVLVLLVATLLLQTFAVSGILRIGRRLEARLRVDLLFKIPRISEVFFQSRPVSDMAERAHALVGLRTLPRLHFGLLGVAFQLVFTMAGLIWHEPRSAPAVIAVTMVSLALGWVAQPLLTERELRVRTHGGALARFDYDALMGTWVIAAHGGRAALMREHEALLVEWGQAQVRLQRLAMLIEGAQTTVGFAFAVWLLCSLPSGHEGSALLVAYWALQLSTSGQMLVALARQLPAQRNIAERLLEPLGTPEENAHRETQIAAAAHAPRSATLRGPSLSFRGVAVNAAGRSILDAIELEVAAGSHVAIVGESGAGKSTLAGLLLGNHRPASGEILVDGAPLTDARMAELRRETAWVDPAVQLWNDRFIDNLTYAASEEEGAQQIGEAIRAADLRPLLERLPDGLQTVLGEGGALVSGGEAQRIRLARAMMQPSVRLAILDEPFRGLDRTQRCALLERARTRWSGATLLCVTHDVAETRSFDRVLVMAGGAIIEDGAPATLAASPESTYARLLQMERAAHENLWGNAAWRRVRVEGGKVVEAARRSSTPRLSTVSPLPLRRPVVAIARGGYADEA